ncbi:hypothetical protein CAPTEDRAFT_224997 [Capitella teleta]|uniref:Glycosyltransferase 61 catalytic domain-containing protein n=1 Tax=Capitella teleta TaxID=283909 RepID=R7V006_CAPTE|nr:hypothetical protein CAPTEDRAFT_224997 [Capitella teleta]|eukprot:ELU12158.1 hypothetical protein CAPTEDRAFT_224997 [Capitella teleta]
MPSSRKITAILLNVGLIGMVTFIFLPPEIILKLTMIRYDINEPTQGGSKASKDTVSSQLVSVTSASASDRSVKTFKPKKVNDQARKRLDAQMKHILSYLDLYTKEIENTGRRLSQEEALDISTTTVYINGSAEGHFEKLKNFPSVSTVFFNKNFEEMKRYMIREYFDYTSNDCNLVEGKSVYGQGLGKELYNATCLEDLNSHLNSRPLQLQHLRLGLPQKFSHVPGHETWTYLNVIQNAVVMNTGDIMSRNLTLIPLRCKDKVRSRIPANLNAIKEHDAVLSVHQYWATGFYHSSLEGMPRLAPYVQFLNDNPHVKIHFQSNNPLQNVLGIRNFKERRLTEQNIHAKILYSPAGGQCGRSPLFTTQLLSMYARKHLDNSFRNKVVLIKRSHKRFFSRHSEIESMLRQEVTSRGLELFVFRDDPVPSLDITMKMFNEAILIVAPHGAGESNILYSQPGTALVEGLCWDELGRGNLCYRNTAQILGLRYHAVFYKTSCGKVTPDQLKEPVLFFLDHVDLLREST